MYSESKLVTGLFLLSKPSDLAAEFRFFPWKRWPSTTPRRRGLPGDLLATSDDQISVTVDGC